MKETKKAGRKPRAYEFKPLQKKVPTEIYKECMAMLNKKVKQYEVHKNFASN